MSSPHSDSYDSHTRKRVGKACDRCRLKKSKCDGGNPCGRCKMDNSICVFGERKRSHDRIIPKGYVEMVEQQQFQIVAGVRKMYRMLLETGQWPGKPLREVDGNPFTHDILNRLGVLDSESSSHSDTFEDDLIALQSRLALAEGKTQPSQRRNTVQTDEESDPNDSAHSTPSLRTASVSSSFSSRSRKRSPSTPAPSEPSVIPSKHQKFEPIQQMTAHLQQQSFVPMPMTADYTASPPTLDYANLDLSSFDNESYQMYDSTAFPTNYMGPTLGNVSVMNNFNNLAFDSDFDVFQHSGLQSGQAY